MKREKAGYSKLFCLRCNRKLDRKTKTMSVDGGKVCEDCIKPYLKERRLTRNKSANSEKKAQRGNNMNKPPRDNLHKKKPQKGRDRQREIDSFFRSSEPQKLFSIKPVISELGVGSLIFTDKGICFISLRSLPYYTSKKGGKAFGTQLSFWGSIFAFLSAGLLGAFLFNTIRDDLREKGPRKTDSLDRNKLDKLEASYSLRKILEHAKRLFIFNNDKIVKLDIPGFAGGKISIYTPTDKLHFSPVDTVSYQIIKSMKSYAISAGIKVVSSKTALALICILSMIGFIILFTVVCLLH